MTKQNEKDSETSASAMPDRFYLHGDGEIFISEFWHKKPHECEYVESTEYIRKDKYEALKEKCEHQQKVIDHVHVIEKPTSEDVQAAFEAWAKTLGLDLTKTNGEWAYCTYKNIRVDAMYEGFKAALEQLAGE